ncbi:hypothetical protein [Rhodoflexus sp.]
MKLLRFVLLVLLLGAGLQAQAQNKQVMIITTIEYSDFLSGANSKMFITFPEGNQQEVEMRGLFSFGGFISEKNIKRNDKTVVDKINEYLSQGWQLEHVSSAIRNGQQAQEGIIFTRYILSKKTN